MGFKGLSGYGLNWTCRVYLWDFNLLPGVSASVATNAVLQTGLTFRMPAGGREGGREGGESGKWRGERGEKGREREGEGGRERKREREGDGEKERSRGRERDRESES